MISSLTAAPGLHDYVIVRPLIIIARPQKTTASRNLSGKKAANYDQQTSGAGITTDRLLPKPACSTEGRSAAPR
jgi:hypothetical protein